MYTFGDFSNKTFKCWCWGFCLQNLENVQLFGEKTFKILGILSSKNYNTQLHV